TPQELRHAKYNGQFISDAEELADWMPSVLTRQFPRIAEGSRRQMKDVEIVATLLLFLEEGPKGYSLLALDEAFSKRDEAWERRNAVVSEFRATVEALATLVAHEEGQFLSQSRFRNQAVFYSLFGAFAELRREGSLPQAYLQQLVPHN